MRCWHFLTFSTRCALTVHCFVLLSTEWTPAGACLGLVWRRANELQYLPAARGKCEAPPRSVAVEPSGQWAQRGNLTECTHVSSLSTQRTLSEEARQWAAGLGDIVVGDIEDVAVEGFGNPAGCPM